MKEDILEQLIDGYFLKQPSVFTKHNIKYRPDQDTISKEEKNKYSVHSDIDIVTVNAKTLETNVITCKSWQGGFNVERHLQWLSNPDKYSTKVNGREVWKSFREITDPVWSQAFRNKILEETNSRSFNYIIAVTKLNNEHAAGDFCTNKSILDRLSGNGQFKVTIKFLTLAMMVKSLQEGPQSTTIESTEIGRMFQLLKAADLKFS